VVVVTKQGASCRPGSHTHSNDRLLRNNGPVLDLTLIVAFALEAVAVGAIVITVIRRRRDPAVIPRLSSSIGLLCASAAILALTLTPTGAESRLQLVPFVQMAGPPPVPATEFVMNVGGNAMLFLPLGAALGALGFRIRTTVLVAFSLSALVETSQLFIPGRTTSVNDLLLNTLGALLGRLLVSAALRAVL
jgi:VanZ like family